MKIEYLVLILEFCYCETMSLVKLIFTSFYQNNTVTCFIYGVFRNMRHSVNTSLSSLQRQNTAHVHSHTLGTTYRLDDQL